MSSQSSALIIVFLFLALAQFTAYLDQTSISAAVPIIGNALDLGPQLSWVATFYLLVTTAVLLLNDRLDWRSYILVHRGLIQDRDRYVSGESVSV